MFVHFLLCAFTSTVFTLNNVNGFHYKLVQNYISFEKITFSMKKYYFRKPLRLHDINSTHWRFEHTTIRFIEILNQMGLCLPKISTFMRHYVFIPKEIFPNEIFPKEKSLNKLIPNYTYP